MDGTCPHDDQECSDRRHAEMYKEATNSQEETKPRKIIYWTHFYGHRDFEFGFGQEPFIKAGCPVTNCITTSKPWRIRDSP